MVLYLRNKTSNLGLARFPKSDCFYQPAINPNHSLIIITAASPNVARKLNNSSGFLIISGGTEVN